MIKERKKLGQNYTDRKTQTFELMVISLKFRRCSDKNLDQETINRANAVSFQPRELQLWIPKGIG